LKLEHFLKINFKFPFQFDYSFLPKQFQFDQDDYTKLPFECVLNRISYLCDKMATFKSYLLAITLVANISFIIPIIVDGFNPGNNNIPTINIIKTIQNSMKPVLATCLVISSVIHAPLIALSDTNTISTVTTTKTSIFSEVTAGKKTTGDKVLNALRTSFGTDNKLQKDLKEVETSQEIVLTLKAYLDEAERDLYNKNWNGVMIYLNTFEEKKDNFISLITDLFPGDDDLDTSAREAMSYETKSMFLALHEFREAIKEKRFQASQKAYAKLLLSYDRFLKAGDLYPTYDAISSTEIFFANTPLETLRFDTRSKLNIKDRAVVVSGPDMGKTGTVIYIETDGKKSNGKKKGEKVILKFDKNGQSYEEVKVLKREMLAKDQPDYNLTKKKKKIANNNAVVR
jgi:hypothetical protein